MAAQDLPCEIKDKQNEDVDKPCASTSTAPPASSSHSQISFASTSTASATSNKSSEEIEDKIVTLDEYLSQQRALELAAAEFLPLKFDCCSYVQGYVNQPVYVCKTCFGLDGETEQKKELAEENVTAVTANLPGVICYACSIACHADHDLIELYVKRNIRCDCGNSLFPPTSPCSISSTFGPKDSLNTRNSIAAPHNLFGRYCFCDGGYDEVSEMLQCLVCEDWFHVECIDKILDLNLFDEYICRTCTRKYPFLLSYGNGSLIKKYKAQNQEESKNNAEKYENNEESHSKRRKMDNQDVSNGKEKCKLDSNAAHQTSFDLFLMNDWRTELCHCSSCLLIYDTFNMPYLLAAEDIYEPEEDPVCNMSLYDAGLMALERLDRSTAIEGAHLYNEFKDRFANYLRKFAEEGKAVTKDDVDGFFEKLSENDRKKKSKEKMKLIEKLQ